jgi:hypothetical protein
MTEQELMDVVELRMADPVVLGRIACNLRSSASVQQRHHDGLSFDVEWEDDGDYWRCTVTDRESSSRLVQVDLHENKTIRADVYTSCRVTVSPEEDLLCVTRYRTTPTR